jgi:sugar lactone lactonase YvrE
MKLTKPTVADGASPLISVLSFPGKVIVLPDGRIVVSDTGHHRLLVLGVDGEVAVAIGSGEPGGRDGSLAESRFQGPQGLAAFDELLFVADSGNHLLREVDLAAGRVRSVAGTGERGSGPLRGTAPALDVALRSPWDLAAAGDYLLIAMAGSHQIWTYHRDHETLGVLAGSGCEALADGAFPQSAFAQPSGLALVGPRLYVVDSETSAVRYLDLVAGRVETLAGADLQHPMGIAHGPAGLLVADTFNSKIRRLDPQTGAMGTFFSGAPGIALGEPGGLCQLPDGQVLVADTNGHRLVAVAADGRSARVLDVRLPKGWSGSAAEVEPPALEDARVGPGAISLRLTLLPPPGFDMAEGSRVSLRLEATGPLAVPGRDLGFEVAAGRRAADAVLRTGPAAGDAELRIHIEAVVCSEGSGACFPLRALYRIRVRVDADLAHGTIERVAALSPPPGEG